MPDPATTDRSSPESPIRPCVKDTEFRFLCSCRDCCRQAARAWHGHMDRVFDGDITLDEANRRFDEENQ